jgi:hypothetical protein
MNYLADRHVFYTNAAEAMRLDSSGNLGIGTTAPGAKIAVAAANTVVASRGTSYLYSTNSMAANLGGQLSFGGSYTGTSETVFGSVAGRKENGTDGDISGYLQFSTTNASLGNVERMRIDSSGNVGIGTSANYGGRLNLVPAATPTTFAGGNTFQIGEATGNTNYRLQLGYINHATAGYIGSVQAYTGVTGSPTVANLTLQGVGGNVGVGTAVPAEKLDVAGNLQVTGGSAKLILYSNQTIASVNTAGSAYTDMLLDGLNLVFRTGSGSASERMRIDSAGFVGIGTNSPLTPLHVAGDSSPVVLNENTVGSIAAFTALGVTYGASFGVNADGTYVTSAANTVFSVSGSETMRIDSSGNVGIGTDTPVGRLQVAEANRVFDNPGNLNVYTTDAATTNTGGSIGLGGANTTGGTSPYVYAKIQGIKEGGASTWNGAMVFGTTAGSSAMTERMRINSSGQVGIGTSAPLANLHVVGAAASTSVDPTGTQILSHAGGFDGGSYGASLNFVQQWWSGAPSSLISVGQITGLKTAGNGNFGGGLAFFVGPSGGGSSTLIEAMRIDGNSGGNVGIGTASPGQKLTVAGTIETTSGGVKYPDGTTQTTGVLEKVDVYSTAGSTTWTKPSWATSIEVILIGGGGGGGSGRKGAAGTLRCGGGGGSGGGFSTTIFPASYVGATETVTVGAGGTGGASQTTNSTNGNNATNGGDTSFGTKLYAPGGGGGAGGTASSGSPGTIARGTTAGGQGALSTSGGGSAAGIGATATGSTGSTYGGGGGGSVTTANAVTNGGQGVNTTTGTAPTWKIGGFSVIPTANSVTGDGNSGTDNGSGVWLGGESGDGGAASTSGNAFNGGNGAKWGSAGGGGGGAVDSVGNSGTGGNGGAGIAIVISRG